MKTLELAKSRIESMDFKSMGAKEIDNLSPVIKKQGGQYILQNAETKKWVAITAEEATELSNLVNERQYGKNWRLFVLGA